MTDCWYVIMKRELLPCRPSCNQGYDSQTIVTLSKWTHVWRQLVESVVVVVAYCRLPLTQLLPQAAFQFCCNLWVWITNLTTYTSCTIAWCWIVLSQITHIWPKTNSSDSTLAEYLCTVTPVNVSCYKSIPGQINTKWQMEVNWLWLHFTSAFCYRKHWG